MVKNEFKLSYTAEDINNKLGKVEEHSQEIIDLIKDVDNLSVFITPQMYGAIGDGLHDDTDAIQETFDANQPIVYFPPGRYKVTKKLVCKNPITIKMCRQYPCDYQKDHPYDDSENWMGARIETSSPDIGIVIGDGVCLDGFSIRAMPGFGGWDIIDYNTGMENDQNLIALEGMSGKGIVLQYDGTLGTATYPSQVRFSHVRVDMAPLLQNNLDAIVPENIYIIPECLFEFRPVKSHNYIFEDIFLGQRHNRYCDNAFRTIIEEEYYRAVLPEEEGTYIWDTNQYRAINEGETGTHTKVIINDPWCNNVYIKNMCIEARCDYGINIINNHSHKKYNSGSQGHTAYGWVFEELNIQAYDYIHKNYAGPLKYNGSWSQWARHNNPLNRKYHKSLIKINGMEDLTFIGCCLHDVVQHSVEQGFSEGIFNIDGQAIHRITEANSYENIISAEAQEYYDKNKENYIIQNIFCVGCSQEFDHIETYLSSKIQQIQEKIEEAKTYPSVESWEMSVVSGENEEGVEGQTLTLKDSYDNTISSFISSTPISEEMINTAVSAWMDWATTPQTKCTNNKLNENINQADFSLITAYTDCNVNTHVQMYADGELHLSGSSTGKIWTSHYLKVEAGDYINVYTYEDDATNGTNNYSVIWAVLYFKASENGQVPNSKEQYLGVEELYDKTKGKQGFQIPLDYEGNKIEYIRLVFMPFNYNGQTDQTAWPRYQALWPGNTEDMIWPTEDSKKKEKIKITINKTQSSQIPVYEPYQITTTHMTLLPTVTAADNGKVLKVVNGKWTAVSQTV